MNVKRWLALIALVLAIAQAALVLPVQTLSIAVILLALAWLL